MRTKRSTDEYHSLLAEKAKLLAGYRDTTLRMKAVLGMDDNSLLRGYIGKRQQLISRIEKIDHSILGLNPGAIPEGFSGGDIGNFKKLLGDISVLDNQCIDLVQAERNKLKDELLGYQRKRQCSKGYRSTGKAPAKFVDTKIV